MLAFRFAREPNLSPFQPVILPNRGRNFAEWIGAILRARLGPLTENFSPRQSKFLTAPAVRFAQIFEAETGA